MTCLRMFVCVIVTLMLGIPLHAAPNTLRIMPLGDSITRGSMGAPKMDPGGYRKWLYHWLTAEFGPVDFVGTETTNPDPKTLPDNDHEGHSGFRIDEIAAGIDGWLSDTEPDVILLAIGTNDMHQSYQLDTAPDRLADLIGQITKQRPGARLIVATIPPSTNATTDKRVAAYNAAIPKIVEAAGPRVSLVDLYNLLGSDHIADAHRHGLHPTPTGYHMIAEAWFEAIMRLDLDSPASASSSMPTPRHHWTMDDLNIGEDGVVTIVKGAALTSRGKIDSALDFDGTGSIATGLKQVLPSTENFSAFTWIKTSKAKAHQYLFSVYESSGTPGRFAMHLYQGRFGTFIESDRIEAPPQIADDQWRHVGVVRFGDYMVLWVDGEPYVRKLPGALDDRHTWYVANRRSGDRGLIGSIDDLRVYHQALTVRQTRRLNQQATTTSSRSTSSTHTKP